MVEVGDCLQTKLNPMRSLGSLGVDNRIRWMNQAFARDDRPRQMEIKFVVVVKMGECLTPIAECGKTIVATGKWLFLDAKLCNARDQLLA